MTTQRALHEIAADIRSTWPKGHYAAAPYLDAMSTLTSINDMYFEDSARSMVTYFLTNAGSWRGDDARRVKAELKGLLK